MNEKDIKKLVRKKRKMISVSEIKNGIQCNERTIYRIENRFLATNHIKYLLFLRKNQVDLNALFDEINSLQD